MTITSAIGHGNNCPMFAANCLPLSLLLSQVAISGKKRTKDPRKNPATRSKPGLGKTKKGVPR